MMRGSTSIALAAIVSLALTAVATWPQLLNLSGTLIGHHDTYFSMWRVGWVAHALATSPSQLFDANIFTPARGTLTYSDAMLLEGFVGAPLLWTGLSPTLVYNLLVTIGYAGSGLAMFVLARHLTGQTGPALVAAAAFVMAPYRHEHVMHLELQWAMWIPLTLWAVHRALASSSRWWGVCAGVCFALQVLSCVYYGVFLAMLLCLIVPLLMLTTGARAVKAVPALIIAGVVALVMVLPYAWPYVETSRALGGRDMTDVVRYSATPANYLSSPEGNLLWGWTANRWGSNETRLFPGAVVAILALIGLMNRSRRLVFVYVAGLAVAVLLSFGINNAVYRWLFEHLSLLQGLRSSARFAIIAMAMLSVLAAFGAQALAERVRWRRALIPVALALIALEGAHTPFDLGTDAVARPSPLYRFVKAAGEGVIVELPVPTLDRLPGSDAYYALWSMQHWFPLVNGYSGYYPQDYVQTMVSMERFPDTQSIEWLRAHNVRYVIVHKAFLGSERYAALLPELASHPEFSPSGTFRDPLDEAAVFFLER